MRVTVTGAHGLTGGAVCGIVAGSGHEVTAVVRRPGLVPHAARTLVTDAGDPDGMARALADNDALIHVAGIQLGERLAMVRELRDLRAVVVVSSAGIYSAHRASAAAYERNERALVRARPDIAIIRPTMIYGSPRDRNVHHVLRFARRWRFLPVPGRGASLIQPIHYLDLAAAICALLDRGASGIVDAGGAESLSLRDAARAVFAALGATPRIVAIPLVTARAGAALLDRVRGSRWRERVERTLEDRSVDNARLVALTGVRPRDFAAGVRQQASDERG